MVKPARLYVTALEVLDAAGRPNPTPAESTRADSVAELVSIIVEHAVGEAGVIAHLLPADVDDTGTPTDPPPSGAHEAALAMAPDVWRRVSAPGGYFSVADYVGRLNQDPAQSALLLLAPYRESWSIA